MNYIEALDWLEVNYPKYDINDRIRIIELAKSGGPFIGPRGGKYKDPQHKIPWKESKSKKPIPPLPGYSSKPTINVINKLKKYSKMGYSFRIQPKNAKVSGYSSMSYGDEKNLNNGVWAFPLMNAVRNIYSSESYVNDVEKDGYDVELAVISGNTEDGPEDTVIVNNPKIIDRFSIKEITNKMDKYFNKEENEIDPEFLDSLW